MRVVFWGVRGSVPVPGPHTIKYGGNSSCLEIGALGCKPLIIDAGTGIIPLGRVLRERGEKHLCMLLSHFHLDHVMGLPFFEPAFDISTTLEIAASTLKPLDHFMDGVFHPLRTTAIPARLRCLTLHNLVEIEMGGYRIMPIELNHPGGALGFRIASGEKSIAYISDTAQLSDVSEKLLIEVIKGVDLLIFDTMFTEDQYRMFPTWGHSFPEYAYKIAQLADAKSLYLFHHSIYASDQDLDNIARKWSQMTSPKVLVAMEGGIVDLEG